MPWLPGSFPTPPSISALLRRLARKWTPLALLKQRQAVSTTLALTLG